MYVCVCAAITDTRLRICVAAGARTVDDIAEACGAGTGCGSCLDKIDTLLAATGGPSEVAGLPRTA